MSNTPTLFARFLRCSSVPTTSRTRRRRRPVRRAGTQTARDAIASYSVANDVSIWDWTYRTTREWLRGRNFEARAPFEPHLVTPDEVPAAAAFGSWVDGEVMWSATIADLLFGPAELVA